MTTKTAWDLTFAVLTLALISFALLAEQAVAAPKVQGEPDQRRLERKLLRASDGVQLPGSESDTVWSFVSFPGEAELPTPERFAELSGCNDYPEGGAGEPQPFDETFDRWEYLAELGGYDPRDTRQLRRAFERNYDELTVYRCETGGPENFIFVLGLGPDLNRGVSGLTSVSIET